MAIKPIRIVISGIDKFSSTIAQSQKKIEKFGRSVSNVGKKMTVGMTIPLIAAGGIALKTTADFEQSMLRVQNLTGATGTQFVALEKQARDLGATTIFSASQAAEGMGYLGMAGFQTNQIMQAMPATLNLAAAAQMELGQSADIVSNILTAYGKDASQTTSVTDLLVDSFQSANTNLEQMAEAMKFVGPVAAGMKIPIEDTATAIGLLSNAGIQGAMAGTQLRGIIGTLADPTNEARAALARLQIPKDQIIDSAGNVKNLGNIIQQFEKHGATTADMLQIFGRRIGPGMAALVSQGSKAFEVLNADLRDNAGSAQSAADVFNNSFIGQVKALRSALEELGIALFKDTGLLKDISTVVKGAIQFVRRLTKVSPGILKLGAVFAAVVAAAGPLLVIIGSLITAVGTISGSIASAGGIVAILSNPIGWVIGAIMAIIGLFALMKTKFGMNIKSMASGLLFFTGPLGMVASLFIKNWGKMLPFIRLIGWLFKQLGRVVLAVLWPVFKLLEKLGDLLGWIGGKLLDLLAGITKIALPKWLEKKLGFTSPEGGPNASVDQLVGRAGAVNKTENETKIVIEDRAGVNLKAHTEKGKVNTEIMRGLSFGGAY